MVLTDHANDLLSHIALRLVKIIEPCLVEQERMTNAQLLMYGSKHLKQNFFLFFSLNNCEYHGVSDLENPARSIDTKFKR